MTPADDTETSQGSPEDAPKPRENGKLARSAARLAAVQALYQMEMTQASWQSVRQEFESYRIGAEIEGAQYREADINHFRALLEGVVTRQAEIDKLTDAALVERWPLGKVDPTLRAIFRAGGFELVGLSDKIPFRVVINEYVDIAQAFYPNRQEPRFVNAVLDHMARRARGEETSPSSQT